MAGMRQELTDLERCVVGVVWRDGPVTAYEIAALFSKSLSPYWSGSAGAIYPLVARLRRRGLIAGQQRPWNGTKKTVLTVTAKGTESLREWLTPPISHASAGPSFDSIRTRLFFLGVLPRERQLAIVDDALRATRQHIAEFERRRREDEAAGNVSEVLGGMGVIFEYRARLRWLAAVRTFVETGRLSR
jgi:DNA-binding PadR family transcriptional regulator